MELFTETYRVRSGEIDRNGRLKLRPFFDFMQDAAGIHAVRLQVGMASLNAAHKSWILSRIRFRIARYPGLYEKITAQTWPSGTDRLFANREVRLLDESGAELAAATTQWLVIDTETGKILPAATEFAEHAIPDASDAFPSAFPSLAKIQPAPETDLARIRIGESRLDVNQHLNNAEYAAIVQDAFGPGQYPAEIQINYQKAVLPGGELLLQGRVGNDDFHLTGRLDGAPAFTAAGFFHRTA